MTMKPNVLLVFSDQEQNHLNWPGLNTPFQDRLKEMGVTFSQAYTTSPQCSPARASLMTGLLPCESKVVANVDATSTGIPLSGDIDTLGNYFKKGGYKTAYFGKWHIGNENKLKEFGFDISDAGDYLIRSNTSDIAEKQDRVIARMTANWIDDQKDGPWFCSVSVNNPHDIYLINKKEGYPTRDDVSIPQSMRDDLSSKPACQKTFLEKDQGAPFHEVDEKRWLEYRSMYYDLIEDVDISLGIILNALDEKNCWENTIVIYTSDHGDLAGAHGMPFKGPCMYEELINIPMYIVWDKHLPKGKTCDDLVSHIDVASTVCSLLDIKPENKLSGIDLLEVAKGSHKGHEYIFCEYAAKQKWFNPIKSVRMGEWKFNHYLNDLDELYHLSKDSYEMENLVADKGYEDISNHLRHLIKDRFKL